MRPLTICRRLWIIWKRIPQQGSVWLLFFKNLVRDNDFQMICLIKPQFEAGKDLVEKGGVVRNPKVHKDIIENIVSYACSIGLKINNLTFSPIKGPHGNIEYLILISDKENEFNIDAENIVKTAFDTLN